MSWFNRYILGPIAPKAALRREAASRGLKAFYEAGEPSRLRKTRTDKRSANAQNERSATPIRTAARHLDENFDIASGILDTLVANTVGTGIWPEPQVMLTDGTPAKDLNRQLLKWFEDWRFRPEVTWQHDYFGFMRLIARSWFRDGEVFSQRITGTVLGLDHGTVIPYSLEGIEADLVPYDLTDAARGIIQGIEVSAWGRPRAYHVYKGHPGDSSTTSTQTKRVVSDNVMHLAMRKRLHQLRGISVFATVLNRLDDIKEIDEAERIAAKVAASMSAVIKKGGPESYEAPDVAGEPREMAFESGMIFDELQPGEDVSSINPTRPNNALIPFRDSQLRAAAAGVGSAFSSISKNYNGTFSAQRQELVEHYLIYQMLAGPIVYGFCQPVWDGFVDAARVSGKLIVPKNVDLETLYDCTHTGPAMPWIDPEKELNAHILAMKWGFKARSKIIRSTGANPDQVNQEILRDQQELEELGIELIGDGKPTEAADAKQDPDPRAGE
jgi:lambda family phage portal protein